MYFHNNAFKGTQEELKVVRELIKEIDNLENIRTVAITYKNDKDRSTREKAIHRLVILGVIEDYTMNYANNEIEIRLSGNEKEDIISSYISYLRNYDRKIAENTEKRIRSFIEYPFNDFVFVLAENLTQDFIYKIIELGRRRSLSEMMDACITDPSDAGIRRRILSYLELGRFSELLDIARENPENLQENLGSLIEQIGSPNEATELRGQTARILESYPNNPALLLIRAIAESMCRDRNEETVLENYEAFITYALAEDVWDLPIEQVIAISSDFINQTGIPINDRLGQDIVYTLMSIVNFDREPLRLIIRQVDEVFSLPAALYLLNELKSSARNLLN
jgi:hypothetical protein